MGFTRLLKRSATPTLIGISSFFLCIFTSATAKPIKNRITKNSSTILQNIKQLCKQCASKKGKKILATQAIYQLQWATTKGCVCIPKDQTKDSSNNALLSKGIPQTIAPTDGDKKSKIILDSYEKIKALYAYDPISQAWIQIQSFKIISDVRNDKSIDLAVDGSPYRDFWAYDLSSQTWHSVSLIPYLQQANTQINSDSSATSTKEAVRPNQSTPLNDVAADALLEELLGVHTLIKCTSAEQQPSAWANLSFDCSIGVGAVFYTNRLDQMQLCQRQNHDYFFITKANEVYKPNWFCHTLNQVTNFDQSGHIEHGCSNNTAFQGKGLGVPITLGIQYVFGRQLLVGVGREMIFNAVSRLVHNDDGIKHKAYMMHKKWSAQGRWFAKCGWYAFNNEKHRFFGDVRLFCVEHLGSMFYRLVNFGPYLHQAFAYNIGLGYEQQLTAYLACTARLAMEWQSFKQFPGTKSHDYHIHYKQPAIYLQMGLSMRSGKCRSSSDLKYREYQNKGNELNDISKLEGLQDLLDMD